MPPSTKKKPSQRPRLLVIAYNFPPVGGGGVQRVAKFVKYLPDFGWDCSVLTVANPSVPALDESLCEEIPSTTLIRRVRTFEPGYKLKVAMLSSRGNEHSSRTWKEILATWVHKFTYAFLHPDPQILWQPGALMQGLRLLKEIPHDAILATAPPFSSFLTAVELSRRSGLPLILDFRDEWGINDSHREHSHKSRPSTWLQQKMQTSVLRRAVGILTTTKRSADFLRKACEKAGSRAQVISIYNGYDSADLSNSQRLSVEKRRNSRFRLTYVGTLWKLTSIEPIVEAITLLARRSAKLAERIELVIVGRQTGEQQSILHRLDGLPCHVVNEGYVSHQRALELMAQADELLLLLSDLKEADRVIPAKTFEYLAMQKPILVMAPPGELTDLLNSHPIAKYFSPSDALGLAEHLERQLLRPTDFVTILDKKLIEPFQRRNLTCLLANFLTQVANSA